MGNKALGPDHCLWCPWERDRRDQDSSWGLLHARRECFAGVTIFDFTGNRRLGIAPDRAAVKRAKTFIAEGLAAEIFTPKIDRVFVGLEQYRLAQQYMEMPDRIGKVVISLR